MGKRRIYPVINTGAEYYAMAMLMRRNIQTFKAPERNEGYDLICISPNSILGSGKFVRIQVKSRVQYDSDCSFCVNINRAVLDSAGFDFLILVFQNVAKYGSGKYLGFQKNRGETIREDEKWLPPEMYTFSIDDLRNNQKWSSGKKMRLGKDFLKVADKYRDMNGIEKIACEIGIKSVQDEADYRSKE